MTADDVHDATPDWAREALAVPVTTGTVRSGPVRVPFREWAGRGDGGVLLVHGGSAHARWWDFVAPLLGDHRVVALDLSGHGDADTRDHYDLDDWTGEVCAVIDQLFAAPPVVIGHSMGGAIALSAAAEAGDRVAATVAIDSLLGLGRAQDIPPSPGVRPPRLTETRAELVSRFRPIPDQGRAAPWMLHYVAHHSIRSDDQGRFRWKFDPRIRAATWRDRSSPLKLTTPVVYYRCEYGLAGPSTLRAIAEASTTTPVEIRELRGVGHNPMLDTPRELAAELTGLSSAVQSRRRRLDGPRYVNLHVGGKASAYDD
ncbi:alpha/beta fold hydrolase [Nakamurella leprariae]|uniref:Alpha/beta hydrolase n=1 Tax=Nakamurella leprariae TaxID=2803911 RepID=A0A938Y8K0_9ACTN|nr:alpha/beta hydrolase [Nakamurella leprariae]MBM9467820.1 alpha/beta hydrolase [Nakamurella leprariae]